jgi:hypothetical protein
MLETRHQKNIFLEEKKEKNVEMMEQCLSRFFGV